MLPKFSFNEVALYSEKLGESEYNPDSGTVSTYAGSERIKGKRVKRRQRFLWSRPDVDFQNDIDQYFATQSIKKVNDDSKLWIQGYEEKGRSYTIKDVKYVRNPLNSKLEYVILGLIDEGEKDRDTWLESL